MPSNYKLNHPSYVHAAQKEIVSEKELKSLLSTFAIDDIDQHIEKLLKLNFVEKYVDNTTTDVRKDDKTAGSKSAESK